MCRADRWFYGPMIYEQKANSGCGSNIFLDLDLLVNRGIGWVGWKYQSGWVEWEFDWNAFAAWYEGENFKESPRRIYNGSGQLIYRGAVQDYDGPIPSIRLKAMRRGLQDHEYFWLLAERTGKHGAADELVNAVVYKRCRSSKLHSCQFEARSWVAWQDNRDLHGSATAIDSVR